MQTVWKSYTLVNTVLRAARVEQLLEATVMPKCLTLCVPLYDIFSYLLVSLSPGVEAPEPKKKKKTDAGAQEIFVFHFFPHPVCFRGGGGKAA